MTGTAARIIFASTKGGTGKTTSCLNVAGYLAKGGSRVLVVDIDPKANASYGLGIDSGISKHSMYDVFLNRSGEPDSVSIKEIIRETDIKNIHVAPSEMDLAVAEILMSTMRNRAASLDRILDGIRPFYDYILVDTPPSSGLLMINALVASDQVVVPLDPSTYSVQALDDLHMLFREVEAMAGHTIHHFMAVLIRHAKPTLVSRLLRLPAPSQAVEAKIREMFQTVFIVPESAEIYRSQLERLPLSHFAPKSKAGRAYMKIAESISIDTHQKLGARKPQEGPHG